VTQLPPPVRRTAHRLAGILPQSVADRLPAELGQRVRAARDWQRERRFALPDSVSPLDNVGYNRSLWDWYADRWTDHEFRQRQLDHEGRDADDPSSVARLGEEWGRLEDVEAIVDRWILPHVDGHAVVGELGTGGGRVARLVAPKVGQFHAFDVAPKMLQRARRELRDVRGAQFHVLNAPALPTELAESFDFVYSFDVFVHLDLHVQWRYLQEFRRVLKPGGRAFVHTSNLTAPAGWERFAAQEYYRVEGFYFMTPEAVRTLVDHSGLRMVDELNGAPGNFYYERDYLVLLEKPSS
jgi:SAM-dependent methyltransferase